MMHLWCRAEGPGLLGCKYVDCVGFSINKEIYIVEGLAFLSSGGDNNAVKESLGPNGKAWVTNERIPGVGELQRKENMKKPCKS